MYPKKRPAASIRGRNDNIDLLSDMDSNRKWRLLAVTAENAGVPPYRRLD
jgi:hypothetical protein